MGDSYADYVPALSTTVCVRLPPVGQPSRGAGHHRHAGRARARFERRNRAGRERCGDSRGHGGATRGHDRRTRRVRALGTARRTLCCQHFDARVQDVYDLGYSTGLGPDRASDVYARAGRSGGDRDGRRRGADHRHGDIKSGRYARIARGARAAGQPPEHFESAEPCARREHGRRRRADERRRRWRHGHHGGRNRGELESRRALDESIRQSKPDFRHEHRLGRGSADYQGCPAGRVRRRRGRPGEHDQPVRHQHVSRLGVL